jgi:RimJ/RimL family protein N-acetyltransferase
VSIRFEPLTRDDLPLLLVWLQKPHVAAWWRDLQTLEHVEAEHLPSIDGTEPSYHYVIVVDGRPVGMIQWYLVSDFPEWEEILDVGEGVAGVDLLIGEEDATGRGLGPEVLRTFISEVVFENEETHAVVAGVEPGNTRSLRAFEKAGFRFEFDYEEEGRPHRLLRLERDRLRPAPDGAA